MYCSAFRWLTGRGQITLTISNPDAVETQSDPSGRLFDIVDLVPGGETISFTLALDADIDDENDVDQSDFGDFQVCFSGAGGPVPTGCELWDLDGDDDVDGDDYTLFESCATGAGIPTSLDCRGLFELMSPSPPGGTAQRRPRQTGQAGPWPQGVEIHGQPSDPSGLASLTVPPVRTCVPCGSVT